MSAKTTSEEETQVKNWRREFLVGAGFPRTIAAELALDETVDIHKAADLLNRGCSVETAVRILG